MPPLVLLETPYAAPTVELLARNLAYARAAMRDSLLRGEAPFASHLLYAQVGVLKDGVPEERERGMRAGWAWGKQAVRVVCYVDLGISPGMSAVIDAARAAHMPIDMRHLPRSAWEAPAVPADLVRDIRTRIDALDPEYLLTLGAPESEYTNEATVLASMIFVAPAVLTVEQVTEVWREWFGTTGLDGTHVPCTSAADQPDVMDALTKALAEVWYGHVAPRKPRP